VTHIVIFLVFSSAQTTMAGEVSCTVRPRFT
jgi:hypothetical protein